MPPCPLHHRFPQPGGPPLKPCLQAQPWQSWTCVEAPPAPSFHLHLQDLPTSPSSGCSWDIPAPSPIAAALHRDSIALTVAPCLTHLQAEVIQHPDQRHASPGEHLLTAPAAFLLSCKMELSFKKDHPSGKEVLGRPLLQSTIKNAESL